MRGLDKPRVSAGLRAPGNDPRMWVEYGVVGVPREDGTIDTTNYHAIHIGPGGCTVDVVLEPSNIPVTCHYNGIAGGRSGWIDVPIHPGDKVVVEFPGGDTSYPRISGFRNNLGQPIPCEAEDGKPVFRNDRVSVYAKDVPIEIRTAGGGRVRVNQDGTVVLNQGEKGVSRVGDSTKLTLTPDDLVALSTVVATVIASMNLFVPVMPPAPAPPTPPAVPLELTHGEITGSSETVKAGD